MSCCGAGPRWDSLTVLLPTVPDQHFQRLLPPPSRVEGPGGATCYLGDGQRPGGRLYTGRCGWPRSRDCLWGPGEEISHNVGLTLDMDYV